MVSNLKLFSTGKFDFRLHHLLIIGILAISFSISFLIRSQSAAFGFELNEFDPFFNYRATQFIVDNGLGAYFEWHDDMTWHPIGRNVSATSQVMLHVTAAVMYQIFGSSSSLYDFTILFPVVFGSLTTIIIFALVRVIGGTTAGLFSSLFFAISLPIIVRGNLGWFKSEPLGLFYGLLGLYLFLSAIKSDNKKHALIKLIGGGIIIALGLASWGGIQFFIIPLGLFFLVIPFVRKDHRFLIWSIPVFTAILLLTAMAFERPGIDFVFGVGGFLLIGPSAFLVICILIQKISKEEKKLRNGLSFLAGTIIAGITMISVSEIFPIINMPSFRYLNAINPFLTTIDPLVDSVAEHATTTIDQSFFFLSVFMIFAGLAIWLILRNQEKQTASSIKIHNDMIAFTLIIGIIGVHVSSAFIRLEVFAALSVIILSSIGLSILTSELFRTYKPSKKKLIKSTRTITKISYVVIILILFILPLSIPAKGNWINSQLIPATILNGGTGFGIATDDWLSALAWLKNNTPQDAVIASWWDYGYWISTLGERKSLADNSTIHTSIIKNIAKMLLSEPDRAWQMLQEMDADYILIFISSQKIQKDPNSIYILSGGGDESKKQWFMRIAEVPLSKFLQNDGISGTDHFWQNTLFGKMIPYSPIGYIDSGSGLFSETYQPGSVGIYTKDIKFPSDGNGPLRLAYSSTSFEDENIGPILGIFIYEINKDYNPNSES
ncbi:MAG: glycosyltransferase family 39 protein [Thaumarchaeota archaeon]|nr:glycosyltransferase family 39 protein [Nitrososphaerota archaeon]